MNNVEDDLIEVLIVRTEAAIHNIELAIKNKDFTINENNIRVPTYTYGVGELLLKIHNTDVALSCVKKWFKYYLNITIDCKYVSRFSTTNKTLIDNMFKLRYIYSKYKEEQTKYGALLDIKSESVNKDLSSIYTKYNKLKY